MWMRNADRWLRFLILALILLGAFDRWLLLDRFGFRYVSNDDLIIWQTATDLAHGIFHWPYFYGQDYNPVLEAWLGAPFVRMGVPLVYLMPLITSFLSLIPFWSFSCWHWRKGRLWAACLFAAMPLLLPMEFGMMTSIVRGSVTGVAVLSILPWASNVRDVRLRAVLVGMIASAAWFINPNSLVFSVPFCLHAWLSVERPFRSLPFAVIGVLPFIGVEYAAQAYCAAHADRVVATIHDWRMVFHAEMITEGLAAASKHFAWTVPLAGDRGEWAPALLLLFLTLACFRKNWRMAIALLGPIALIVISFGFAKVHDGEANPLFAHARMFLAMPWLLAWAFTTTLDGPVNARVSWLLGLVALGAFAHKTISAPSAITGYVERAPGQICIVAYDHLVREAEEVSEFCRREQVKLIASSPSACEILRCQAYPLLRSDMPPTYVYTLERRWWIRQEVAQRVFPTVLVLNADMIRWKEVMHHDPSVSAVQLPSGRTMHLVKNNGVPTDSLMQHTLWDPLP